MMTKSTTLHLSFSPYCENQENNIRDQYTVGKVIPFRITSDKIVNGTITKIAQPPDRNALDITFEFDEEVEIEVPVDSREMTVSEEGQ